MKDVNVVVTSCGGTVLPGIIQCLNTIEERKIRVIGVDMKEDAVGFYMTDKYYVVPPGDSPDYISTMLDISKRENVDVIMPVSQQEFIPLSKHRQLFEDNGTIIACSGYDSMRIANDKGLFLEFLRARNLPCAEFYVPKTIDEFEQAVYKLGYPHKAVVMKPRISAGNRGFRILREDMDEKSLLLSKTDSAYASLSDMVRVLKDGTFPDLVVMEYLPGEEYSVDLLAKEGKALIIVPKVRVEPLPGLSRIGVVRRNPEVERLVSDVSQAFNFDYNINIQLKYSEKGEPLAYEINPRIAASVILCAAAGANLVYYGVKLALGEEVPNVNVIDGTRMVRYWKELFIGEDGRLFQI
jgi:carbamoyl-phosphate synthase large subunit